MFITLDGTSQRVTEVDKEESSKLYFLTDTDNGMVDLCPWKHPVSEPVRVVHAVHHPTTIAQYKSNRDEDSNGSTSTKVQTHQQNDQKKISDVSSLSVEQLLEYGTVALNQLKYFLKETPTPSLGIRQLGYENVPLHHRQSCLSFEQLLESGIIALNQLNQLLRETPTLSLGIRQLGYEKTENPAVMPISHGRYLGDEKMKTPLAMDKIPAPRPYHYQLSLPPTLQVGQLFIINDISSTQGSWGVPTGPPSYYNSGQNTNGSGTQNIGGVNVSNEICRSSKFYVTFNS